MTNEWSEMSWRQRLGKNRRYVVGAVLPFILLGIPALFISGPASSGPASTQDLLNRGSRRELPPSPHDVMVMGVWRNGQFHVIKLRTKSAEIDTPEGKVGERTVAPSREEVEKQLPPVDPAFDHVSPTDEQIREMEAKVHAEQVKHNPPGTPTAPPEASGRVLSKP